MLHRLMRFFVCALCLYAAGLAQGAREYYVSPAGADDNPGSQTQPLKTIAKALASAQPGDTVIVGDGTYAEELSLNRGGTSDDARLTLKAETPRKAIISRKGRTLTVTADYVTIRGLVFDAQYGNETCVRAAGEGIQFIGCEIRRAGKIEAGKYGDGLQFFNSKNCLVEDCYIHHHLAYEGERQDSHGIRFTHSYEMTVRRCKIELCSGDSIQADPNREAWDNVVVEECELIGGPMPDNDPFAHPAFAAGTVPGENGIDTKALAKNPRAQIIIRRCVFRGFRGPIGNAAALNLKENVEALVDSCTVSDSEICFRLRGPASKDRGGAQVILVNCVMHNADVGIRYEDKIEKLKVWHSTWGGNVGRPFTSAGGYGAGFEVKNCLFLLDQKPKEAADASNLAVKPDTFVDPANHHYHPKPDSPAVDAGTVIDEVKTDRDGEPRPKGKAPDVGAYEVR